MSRHVLAVVNGDRQEAVDLARTATAGLQASGVRVSCLPVDQQALGPDVVVVQSAANCDLIVVFGGDGTILRAAELARPHDVAVLGVNIGRVGFLAEAEPENINAVIDAIVDNRWDIEQRVAVSVTATTADGDTWQSWGLNEAVIERHQRERMARLAVSIDGRPLSQWSCDGVLCSTPTGSTAYAFSAGGPVVWPEVDAFLLVPINAHALFARPMVVSPASTIDIEIEKGPVMVSCDGRRTFELSAGAHVRVVRDPQPVKFARVHRTPFSERLVAKFQLPVEGWRTRD